jgi:hypothetical protein
MNSFYWRPVMMAIIAPVVRIADATAGRNIASNRPINQDQASTGEGTQ